MNGFFYCLENSIFYSKVKLNTLVHFGHCRKWKYERRMHKMWASTPSLNLFASLLVRQRLFLPYSTIIFFPSLFILRPLSSFWLYIHWTGYLSSFCFCVWRRWTCLSLVKEKSTMLKFTFEGPHSGSVVTYTCNICPQQVQIFNKAAFISLQCAAILFKIYLAINQSVKS